MNILDWLLRRNRTGVLTQERARIDETLERILQIIPRLRNAANHRQRLTPAIATSLQYLDGLLASLPGCHEGTPDSWSTDPYIRAFFSTPADIAIVFSRSEELHKYFDHNPTVDYAYTTLGMTMNERHVFGVAMEGDMTRHDVQQTTLSFFDHRVTICARTEADLRQEIEHRLVDQLALEGLAKLGADCRELLEQGRALLQQRLTLLQRQGIGMQSVVGGTDDMDAEEWIRVQAQIVQNACDVAELTAPAKVIQHELDRVCEILGTPASHTYITKNRFCIDQMNVIRSEGGRKIDFHVARIPANPVRMRAFALVRFPRAQLLPVGLHFDAVIGGL
ncbi:hypothetical protein AWB81_06639 [Caballeronia arationis]|jgi:hypothetical protein|uniref:Uncharacterized protein n=1 Tax=Caballeronia arationis TaxID=1777142 RepID=A0A7Z7N2L5_9BURK|nr:hypothetical protein [Caballeronia arationis]SAL04251.1 hypothetical protein AWB81_06639 [Caballeronia arationis]SOE67207.1 hypothetical protein SAMN05446927_3250 [Caballeronia arationis]